MTSRALDSFPASSRVWVFGSRRALSGRDALSLLGGVDEFLSGWRAHGLPLTAARAWTDDRFLTVAVDQTEAHASGCSIDGLYRHLQRCERDLNTELLAGGRVFFRDFDGTIRVAGRGEFARMAGAGEVSADTQVFDTTVQTLAEWRQRFPAPARDTWAREFLEPG